MRLAQISSYRDVTRLSLVVTLMALTVVTLLTVLLYPREEWPWEILVSWPTTTLLAYGATRVIGRQMLKVHALNVELQRLVSRDRLTDVATRDFFFDRLAERPAIHGVSLMVDIDHFKRVNDTHGHLAGDKVIAHVAHILAQEVGARDIVCRFGGEEFVVFLENATQVIAREVAERFRERVEATPVDSDGIRIRVSVSIGGSLRQPAADIEVAIREADAALYRAKALGRNRTVMADKALRAAPPLQDWDRPGPSGSLIRRADGRCLHARQRSL
jgi:diguanylate cyclase (GGDEF)-like protein